MTKDEEFLPIEELHKRFNLDEHGELTYKETDNYGRIIKIGVSRPGVYKIVGIDEGTYYVHRIVFAMTHGRWPVDQLDHIDRNTQNNRPSNLREATHTENCYNRSVSSNNTSGSKNVSWQETHKAWHVRVQVEGKRKHIGYFKDLELAELVGICAMEKYHKNFANYGIFP